MLKNGKRQKDEQIYKRLNTKLKNEQYRPHKNMGRTQVIQKIKQYIFHIWHRLVAHLSTLKKLLFQAETSFNEIVIGNASTEILYQLRRKFYFKCRSKLLE